MGTTDIIIVTAIGIIVLLVIFVLLFNKFHLSKRKMVNQTRVIERKFQYYHSLLTGSCLQIISRLEVISHSNLVYATYHIQFFKRYKDILDNNDKALENDIYSLNDLLTSKDKKQFKESFARINAHLNTYVSLVNKLNDDLLAIIKSEEETRELALRVKEHTNNVRKKYVLNSVNFQLVNPTFEKIFNKIDNSFRKFETKVDAAEYDEAKSIIDPIDKVLSELDQVIDELPAICLQYENDIPASISSLRLKYDEVSSKKIPLYVILNDDTFAGFDKKLQIIHDFIMDLKVSYTKDEINNLSNLIKSLSEGIDNECKCKEEFDQKFNDIYSASANAEKRAIKTYNSIESVKRYYVFNDFYKNVDVQIKNLTETLTTAKRKVDTYIHNSQKQPYSLVMLKVNELGVASNALTLYIDDFSFYIKTLKENCENAYNMIFSQVLPLKESETKLKLFDLKYDLFSQYEYRFNRAFDLLNQISSLIKVEPINVENLNKLVAESKKIYDNLMSDFKNLVDARHKCISLFKTLNDTRDGFANVNDDLIAAEKLFSECNYNGALDILSSCANKHSGIENASNNI